MSEAKKVLVIDDEEIVRAVVGKVVGMLGAEVIIARNGEEGRRKLAEPGLDLVITDLLMPELTGWDVVDHLNRNPLTSDIPVIILTGTQISTQEKRRLLNKANAVVDKSLFSVEKFSAIIKACSTL